MFAGLQGWHLLIILAVILLLFGAPKLPQLARSVGQSMRIFKSEMKTKDPEAEAPTVPPTADRPTGAAYTGDTTKSTESGDNVTKP